MSWSQQDSTAICCFEMGEMLTYWNPKESKVIQRMQDVSWASPCLLPSQLELHQLQLHQLQVLGPGRSIETMSDFASLVFNNSKFLKKLAIIKINDEEWGKKNYVIVLIRIVCGFCLFSESMFGPRVTRAPFWAAGAERVKRSADPGPMAFLN